MEQKREKKVTIPDLLKMKREGRKITMVTAYDYPSALLVDQAGIDIILVGDSVGMVVLGYESTIPVTVDEIIHHTKAVVRGARRPLIVGDMPFMSYHASIEDAIRNAGRIVKEGGADAVKLEGGKEVAKKVQAIVEVGIPVMAHIGLTPQRVSMIGGYKVQGKDAETAKKIIEDAITLEEAGAFAIVYEFVTAETAKIITEKLTIPTIGIGSGPYCDGQVLVLHDILGMFKGGVPPFAKQYAQLSETILRALETYRDEVSKRMFPAKEHTFYMGAKEYKKLLSLLKTQ